MASLKTSGVKIEKVSLPLPTSTASAIPTATQPWPYLWQLRDANITSIQDGQSIKWDAASNRWINVFLSSGGVSYLTQLLDVNIASVQNGQTLTWNATSNKWVNVTPAVQDVPYLYQLKDANITSIQNGQTIKWDTTISKWLNTTLTVPNLSQLPDTNITSIQDGNIIQWDAASSKWLNKVLAAPATDSRMVHVFELSGSQNFGQEISAWTLVSQVATTNTVVSSSSTAGVTYTFTITQPNPLLGITNTPGLPLTIVPTTTGYYKITIATIAIPPTGYSAQNWPTNASVFGTHLTGTITVLGFDLNLHTRSGTDGSIGQTYQPTSWVDEYIVSVNSATSGTFTLTTYTKMYNSPTFLLNYKVVMTIEKLPDSMAAR